MGTWTAKQVYTYEGTLIFGRADTPRTYNVDEPCKVCAPRVPGKDWAAMARCAAHPCIGGILATSKTISWHTSREAAMRHTRISPGHFTEAGAKNSRRFRIKHYMMRGFRPIGEPPSGT